jgi:AraC-like DNA-binding protein
MEFGFREFDPHPALARYVDRFWARSNGPSADGGPLLILPDGCIDLIVDLSDGWNPFVVGAMTRATAFEPEPQTRLIGARFRPGGAIPFLKVAAHEITDHVVDSADVGLRWVAPIPTARHLPIADAVRVLERLLLERLAATTPPNPVVAHVVATLFGSTAPSVETLAREIGWSRQHLRRVVRHHVGFGPMTLARVARLQRAADLLQRSGGKRLSMAALSSGYFDQAHMNRDFRELAGVTPLHAAESTGSIFPIRSLLCAPSSLDDTTHREVEATADRALRPDPFRVL